MAEFGLAGEYGAPESNFGFGDLAGTNNLGSGAGGYNLGGGSTYGLGDSFLGGSAFGDTGLGDFGNFDSFNSSGLDGPSAGLWGNTSNPTPSGFQQGVTTMNDFFSKNPFGKMASMALNFVPGGGVFNAARSAIGAHTRGNTMGAINAAMGALGGPVGAIGSLATSNNPGASFAGAGGSMLGNMIGGPVGGMIGGQLGGMAARSGGGTGYNGGLSSGSTGSNGGGYGVEGIAGDLAKMYAMSKASGGYGAAKDANSAIQGQISSLSNMYGPNSPYAQQLRQTLERKDAAAGRRSQYGPREVQLQAALADKAAQTAGTIGNLAQQSQTQSLALKNQKDQQRAQQLAMLFKMGQGSGVFNSAGQGLRDLFNDSTGQTPYANSYNYGDTGGVSLGGNNFGTPAESYSSNNDWMNLGY